MNKNSGRPVTSPAGLGSRVESNSTMDSASGKRRRATTSNDTRGTE